jgi:preprotein translocase subunit SecY
MKHCPDERCPYRARTGEPAEYGGATEICSDCGATLVEGDAPAQAPAVPAEAPPPSPWFRAGVTLAGPALLWALGFVMLPQIDRRMFEPMLRDGGWQVWNALPKFSVVALGIAPFITGMTLVEWAALIVPAWRPLRNGTPEDRAWLRRVALWVVGACALFQGFGIAVWLESLSSPLFGTQVLQPFSAPGPASRFGVAVTLALGTALAVVLASAVGRHGLGNGVSVLLLAGGLPTFFASTVQLVQFCSAAKAWTPLFVAAACAGSVVASTWFVLTRAQRGDAEPDVLRHPACGAAPLEYAIAVLGLLTAAIGQLGGAHSVALAVGAALFAVLFTVLFNRPDYIAEQLVRLGAGDEARISARVERDLMRGGAIGLAYVGVLLGALALAAKYRIPVMSEVALAIGTAVVMDLIAEWRMRVRHPELASAWELHRVWAVDPAVRLLAQEGIAVLPRGVNHRALMHFFAPYVPIELLVPVADSARARELLERAFGPKLTDRSGE